jgi:hypothetical protein
MCQCVNYVAFSCVNHERLLHKLQFYGLRGVILNWVKSCYSTGNKRVELKFLNTYNYSSNQNTVKCEVPQYSVLGPLLFNMYIDDFPGTISKPSQVIMFADGSSIYILQLVIVMK